MKRFACMITALFLLAVLAVPAFAEPVTDASGAEVTTAIEGETIPMGTQPVTEEVLPTDPNWQPYHAGLAEETEPEKQIPMDTDEKDGGFLGVTLQDILIYCALGIAGLALIFSIIALIKTRKKTARNSTGNYTKYF